ncbi:GTPase ObgE [Candidatus Kaiserbacteria bacterium]|nr:GTPase ObgE [Candidatus Kaiserbacteria bacterium]
MFVDELKIYAKAGDGGDGVVRWNRVKFKPKGGPAGGNGGRGGDVYLRAVPDLNRLAKYTGAKEFKAKAGEDGRSKSEWGKAGEDVYIEVPVGSVVTDLERNRVYELFTAGQEEKILKGGHGGLGNENFKSSVNRSPEEFTTGAKGEEGDFLIELSLVVDVGLVGLPNAGKSTLLNAFTNATSPVGSYAFTTVEPHLGALYEFSIADIPGLIAGAAEGKGLGHKFLKHVSRTKMILHLVSLENEDPKLAYETVIKELQLFSKDILDREQWIILTKSDLINKDIIDGVLNTLDNIKNRVFVISVNTGEGVKELRDSLVSKLREG